MKKPAKVLSVWKVSTMLKNRALLCLLLISCAVMFSSCDSATTINESITNTTKAETKAKTTTEETYYISESEAERIATEYVKEKYDKYSPVVIGEVTFFDDITDTSSDTCRVKIKGHYWVKDEYGHTNGDRNFTETVTVNKKDKKATGSMYAPM